MVYSLKIQESVSEKDIPLMEIRPVAVATFARFYEAPGPEQERMVREARRMQAGGYPGRDYYAAFRNALAETHWRSNEIETFEFVLDGLVAAQKSPTKQKNYRTLGDTYIKFWKKREGARVFTVPTVSTEFEGLTIRVYTEIGMSYGGNDMALKLYLRAPQRPTRSFRQAIEHITTKARQGAWNPNWQSAILDLHREDILISPPIPDRFSIVVEGQAQLFQYYWNRLDRPDEQELDGSEEF